MDRVVARCRIRYRACVDTGVLMKRMSVAVLAALMAVSMAGAAGCAKRKSNWNQNSESSTD